MATMKTYEYTPYSKSDDVQIAEDKKKGAETAYKTYVDNGYTASEDVINAGTNKTNAETAYNEYFNKGFTYGNQSAFNDVMGKILNGEKFSYDLNGDALYQQYKDKYIQQGKMAMADTMGQASAMTGGYGNSYAASVGNQAYQASLQNLNDVSLQLYQMAYDRYSQDRQDLFNQYGMLSDDRNTQYGMWSDEGNRLGADRSYYTNAYDSAYNRDYGQWVDKGTMLSGNRDYYGNEYNNAYNRDYAEHTTQEGYNYQAIADENSWNQWEAGHNLAAEQFKLQKAQAGATKNSDGTYTVPSYSPTLSASEYNEVMTNAEGYAAQGETALANYLNGLVGRGLSEDEAYAIYEQYFPSNIPTAPGKGATGRGTGKFGVKEDVIN